jgi:protein TonB
MSSKNGPGGAKNPARFAAFALACALHAAILFFAVFTVKSALPPEEKPVDVMRLADIRERPPAAPPPAAVPPVPPPQEQPVLPADAPPAAETIAETIIESDEAPPPSATASAATGAATGTGEYLPARLVSALPRFSETELKRRLVYPAPARRAGIEGTVYLELLVDPSGFVRGVTVLREHPAGRGFGDAAARAFQELRAAPALLDGVPVACRYRYPVRFELTP